MDSPQLRYSSRSSVRVHRKHSLVLITALAAIVQPAYGAPPPNVVDSDAHANTAMGAGALGSLTNGSANTASGYLALGYNATGHANTASGAYALFGNTTGHNNTAFGIQALSGNQSGNHNVAIGAYALVRNSTAEDNTATGYGALGFNTIGKSNTATGSSALINNTSGNGNTAQGTSALYNNTTGTRNVGVGNNALLNNSTGRNNTAIGFAAGQRTTGHDNVLIAHRGAIDESQTMRIGTRGSEGVPGSGVTRTFIAGIRGVTTSRPGIPVLIDSAGQLGTISSSRRRKQDIEAMADASDRLLQLRPVKFHYTEADASGERPVQYGLIAEEVAEVFPELVILDEEGKPETVAYHMLPALLLNELQKEHQLNRVQSEKLAKQEEMIAAQALHLAELNALRGELAEVKELLAALQTQNTSTQLAMK
jgi:hypothetical protein